MKGYINIVADALISLDKIENLNNNNTNSNKVEQALESLSDDFVTLLFSMLR